MLLSAFFCSSPLSKITDSLVGFASTSSLRPDERKSELVTLWLGAVTHWIIAPYSSQGSSNCKKVKCVLHQEVGSFGKDVRCPNTWALMGLKSRNYVLQFTTVQIQAPPDTSSNLRSVHGGEVAVHHALCFIQPTQSSDILSLLLCWVQLHLIMKKNADHPSFPELKYPINTLISLVVSPVVVVGD